VARLAVAATAPFGADVLERLAAEHDVEYLLTRPDRPRGRGRRVGPPPAKEVAERLGIPVRQPPRLDESFDPEVETVVVVAYGLIIPGALLDRARWLNVHPSLLPRWRGAAPIIELVEELDAGPIAAQEAFPVDGDENAGDVFARAVEVTPALVATALANRDPTPQPNEGVTYAEKIVPADRELDWPRPPQELHNRIRALAPHIGARGEVDGRPLIVWRSRLVDGRLELLEVQPEGRRRMSYEEYLRGLR
jgi:methionyl-tRNA formyltransferase